MGSYPMRDGVHDFNADASNEYQDKRSFPNSGVKAGVEDGLSMVERSPRGTIQPEQKTSGNTFRQDSVETSAGSKGGKSFDWKY